MRQALLSDRNRIGIHRTRSHANAELLPRQMIEFPPTVHIVQSAEEAHMLLWSNSITDDTGLLGVVNSHDYATFVDLNWEYEQLMQHFKAEMAKQFLLLWATGLEGMWRVRIYLDSTEKFDGYREVSGPIKSTKSGLSLINYESLTMAAQYEYVTLPEDWLAYCQFELAPGNYNCTIIQMFDPILQSVADGDCDFIIQLSSGASAAAAWEKVPWDKF